MLHVYKLWNLDVRSTGFKAINLTVFTCASIHNGTMVQVCHVEN